MADPNDSPDQHAQHTSSPDSPSNPAVPEVVDAEPVDEPRPTTTSEHRDTLPPPQQDDEAFRQYQQFLEFRKFQEWQRQYGEGETPGSPGKFGTSRAAPAKRAWWKRALGLLRYKLVRRLLYVFVVLLLLNAAIDYYVGGDDSGNTGGGAPGATAGHGVRSVLPSSPEETVTTVYDFVATKPATVCVLFTPAAKARFAANHGTPDCTTAARQLHARVTLPKNYKSPEFGKGAVKIVGTDASVSSCLLDVRGGPRLGKFGLERRANGGWIIDGHEKEPSCRGE
ncbi:hypothetical protein [Halopolyspora algeriensis]|uniref:hypothetical protein n=1 Tax=Halopolyspora algeriensis TaxID=1500506 RepID=UPI000DF49D50|nr:hypothetical protein [Halopolyspora algeriensis]